MEPLQTAVGHLNAARKLGTTATSVSLVLFAALIVFWLNISDHVNSYRRAVESKIRVEKQNRLAEHNDKTVLGQAVKGRLYADATAYEDKPTRKKIIELADSAAQDPEAALDRERKANKDSLESLILAAAIASEQPLVGLERRHAIVRFHLSRDLAERTAFKLFGLDFSVKGFWAWTVWMGFFAGGILYLWLGRRAIIRRHRQAWRLLSSDAVSPEATSRLADSLPLWARPFPKREEWTQSLTNKMRTDLILEPLSVLCLLLLALCVALALIVARLGIVSTALLEGSPAGTQYSVHAACICLLCGISLGLLATWPVSPRPITGKAGPGGNTKDNDLIEIVGRRTWISGLTGTVLVCLIYLPRIHAALLRSLLQNPRFHGKPKVTRARMRRDRQNTPVLSQGFYTDHRGRVHYVPASGRSRSLSGQSKDDLEIWNGPFDKESLSRVHPCALVPFVREGVTQLLHGLRHRKTVADRAKILALPETTVRYHKAFELVEAGLFVWVPRRTMPNLQLYDLLFAVAENAASDELLTRAIRLLTKVPEPGSGPELSLRKGEPQNENSRRSSMRLPLASMPGSGSLHSRHSIRKAKLNSVQRRRQRLDLFKGRHLEGVLTGPRNRLIARFSRTSATAANQTLVVRRRKKTRVRKRQPTHRRI